MNLFQVDDVEFSSSWRERQKKKEDEIIRDEARSADKSPSSFLQVANTIRELQLNAVNASSIYIL